MKKTILKSLDDLKYLFPTSPSILNKVNSNNKEVSTQSSFTKSDVEVALSTPYSRFKAKRALKSKKLVPRIATLALKFRIPSNEMIIFLKERGFISANENSLLNLNEFNLIHIKFISPKLDQRPELRKIEVDLEKCRIDVTSTETAHKPTKLELLSLESDEFSKNAAYIAYPGFESFHSNFSDDQAILICSKMSNSYVRSLCKNVHGPDKRKTLYQIHYISNKALKLFGGKILTFIMNLRALEFSTNGSIEITNFREVLPDFPFITVESDEGSFFISFFLKKDKNKKNKLMSSVTLHLKESGEMVAEIDERGVMTARLQKFYPKIKLYCKILKDQSMQIFSGVETGKCEVCGHTLTSSTSCKIGIGPICAERLGLDQSLYHF